MRREQALHSTQLHSSQASNSYRAGHDDKICSLQSCDHVDDRLSGSFW